MTSRSPTQQYPKTTTISRRLRYRADQGFSVQPPEIPRLRNVRPRRAATLPEPHYKPLDSHRQGSDQLLEGLRHEDLASNLQISCTLKPAEIDAQAQPVDSLGQTLDLRPYNSPPGSAIVTNQTRSLSDLAQSHYLVSDFPPSPLPSVSGSLEFDLSSSYTNHQQSHNSYIDPQDMSTLGFMMAPSQYGMNHYGSASSYPQNYPPGSQHGYIEHRASTSGPYDSSYAPSPALPHEQRRPDDQTVLPPYQSQPQALSRSPYQQQPPNVMRPSSTALASNAPGYGYGTSHGNSPNQQLASNASSYPPPQLYPPTSYGVSDYHPLPTMYPPSSTTPAAYPSYGSPSIPQPPNAEVPPLSPSPSAQGSAVMPRILNSRPKPQCWEHGCNGRQFSTFSNLLRHQREKSGTASKSYCPRCGAEFTRTTARNGHMAHDKCKPRRPSESSH